MTQSTANAQIGVNAAGFLRGGLGLGQAARLYVQALHEAGVPIRTTTLDVNLPDVVGSDGRRAQVKTTDFADLHVEGDLPFNLICVNAPELPAFHKDLGETFFEGRYTIGVWAWEVNAVPGSWDRAFGLVDEIWTYSRYVQEIFEQVSPIPVVRMPLPIVAPPPGGDISGLRLADGFTFLFLFDFYSTLARKNPLGLIEAFTRAFAPGEGPHLVLKSHNGDFKPERMKLLTDAIGDRPDIRLVDEFLAEADMAALMRRADCYVSLHRAEGFGLTLGETMALGKPVIATGFSANLDFMTEANSYLVRHTETQVGSEGENYPEQGIWAEPDLDHAAELLRAVWTDQEEARRRGERGRRDIAREFSLEAVGEQARGRLKRLASVQRRSKSANGRLAAAGPEDGLPPESYLDLAELKLTYDPMREALSEGGARGNVRRVALQAMRPYTHHQDELNRIVAGALREANERIEDVILENQRIQMQMRRITGAIGDQDMQLALEGLRARAGAGHPAITRTDEQGRRVLGFEARAGEPVPQDVWEILGGDQHGPAGSREAHADVLGDDPFDLDAEGNLELLRDVEEGVLTAVFASAALSSLTPAQLDGLLRAIVARLAPGGVVVLDAPNPHNPASMKLVWADPGAQRPLFPELLVALCRVAGFGSATVRLAGGGAGFDDDIYSCRRFAVVARVS